jgi:hypothetical protein
LAGLVLQTVHWHVSNGTRKIDSEEQTTHHSPLTTGH